MTAKLLLSPAEQEVMDWLEEAWRHGEVVDQDDTPKLGVHGHQYPIQTSYFWLGLGATLGAILPFIRK